MTYTFDSIAYNLEPRGVDHHLSVMLWHEGGWKRDEVGSE